ncbi:hypothetical protein OSB04_031623 [Centaurea solstitialis]|uniref:Uncharacterized protein n=1 Tax=Centaurea solstitialis TaxID=347529 RepID=A0AA38S9W2_9ASTR|nr:hypothetical protein OSB04_031623 [Centaurea solstitialis]
MCTGEDGLGGLKPPVSAGWAASGMPVTGSAGWGGSGVATPVPLLKPLLLLYLLLPFLLHHRRSPEKVKRKPEMKTYSYLVRSSSQYRRRKSSRRPRCLTIAKQQKTRFYILRRCISMLVCWNDNYD